jgi:5-methylcytosine-specific restriction endonuclease McrA
VLREVRTASFGRRLTLLGWRYHLLVGDRQFDVSWRTKRYRAIREVQQTEPVALVAAEGRVYWLSGDCVYWEDEDLDALDVLALIRDRDRRRRRKLERARASMAAEETGTPRREGIARDVKLMVFERDQGRCVECGSAFDIQYDHVIPFAMGGASTVENLQILCAECNRSKGATLG